MGGVSQPLPDKVLPKLKEIAAWLEKDVQDQFNDLHHFEEMFEPISQELPEDIRASLSSVYDLEPLYVPLSALGGNCALVRPLKRRKLMLNTP
jgi:hypothetical protein